MSALALATRYRALLAEASQAPGERLAWSIRAEAGADTATVHLYGAIDGWELDGAKLAQEIRALDVGHIDLRVNSPGGDVFDAIGVYTALAEHRATVTAHVDGLAASAASYIVQAGDTRNIMKPARMMIHDARGLAYGPPPVVRELADILDAVSDDIAGIYADRAGGTVASWRTAMASDTWYSSAEAVKSGLADAVVNPAGGSGKSARAAARAQAAAARHRARVTALRG